MPISVKPCLALLFDVSDASFSSWARRSGPPRRSQDWTLDREK